MNVSLLNSLSESAATFFFEVIVRSTALFAACALITPLLRSRTAEVRHLIWRAALYGLLLMPLFQFTLPRLHPSERVIVNARTADVVTQERPAPRISQNVTRTIGRLRVFPLTITAVGLYLLVTLILLARLLLSLVHLKALRHRSEPILDLGLAEFGDLESALRLSTEIRVPIAFGLRNAAILLPATWKQWPNDKLRAVLIHERAHLLRRDPATALLASLACCLFWMHPFVYLLRRQLTKLAEQSCDEAVIRSLSPERYCRILLEFTSEVAVPRDRFAAACAVAADRSFMKKRIEWIFHVSQQPRIMSSRWLNTFLLFSSIPVLYLTSALDLSRGAQVLSFRDIQNQQEANKRESDLRQNPDDLETRVSLMAFYSNTGKHREFTKLLLWEIEHHPEADASAMRYYGRPDQAHYHPLVQHGMTSEDDQLVKAAWEHALETHPNSPEVLYDAALFFERYDPARALALLKKSMALPNQLPQDSYRLELSVLCAAAVSEDHKLGSINNIQMTPNASAVLLNEIETSSDPALLSRVGTMLVKLFSDKEIQIGLSFIQQAISLDPHNPAWTEALESAKFEPIRRRNYAAAIQQPHSSAPQ